MGRFIFKRPSPSLWQTPLLEDGAKKEKTGVVDHSNNKQNTDVLKNTNIFQHRCNELKFGSKENL